MHKLTVTKNGVAEVLTSEEIAKALNQNDREHRKHLATIIRLEKHDAKYSLQDYDILSAACRAIY